MTDKQRDVLIGIDAGTSVIKAVGFDLAGRQLGAAAVPNRYATGAQGAATQDMARTWEDCAAALRGLADHIPNLAGRTAALSVTGQGDGTWLVGDDGLRRTDAERRVVVQRVVLDRSVVDDLVALLGEVVLQLRRELEARVIGRDVDAHAPIL